MGSGHSELSQHVAGVFSTPRDERQARALPLLRELRASVVRGASLTDALGSLPVGVEREFARAEIRYTVLFVGAELEQLDRAADTTLRLWFVDRALRSCGGVRSLVGGHYVTQRPRVPA